MNTQIGSVLINENDESGIVVETKTEYRNDSRKTVLNRYWVVRTVKQYQNLVTQRTLVSGNCVKWKDTGIVVNPSCYGIEAFTLQEIKILATGGKLPHPMSKKFFLEWVEAMFLLAKDQRKFGQYGIGRSTAESLKGTIKKAFFYFDVTKEENERFEAILSELWILGYYC